MATKFTAKFTAQFTTAISASTDGAPVVQGDRSSTIDASAKAQPTVAAGIAAGLPDASVSAEPRMATLPSKLTQVVQRLSGVTPLLSSVPTPVPESVSDASSLKLQQDSSVSTPTAEGSPAPVNSGSVANAPVTSTQGAVALPIASATSSKVATSQVVDRTAGRAEAGPRHSSVGSALQAAQSHKGKGSAPSSISGPLDPQQLTPDSKSEPHNDVPDDSNASPDFTNGASDSTTTASTTLPHALAPQATPVVMQQDAAAASNNSSPNVSTPVSTPHSATSSASSNAQTSASANPTATSAATLPDADGTQMHFVGNAKLVQAASHSEMRIAMDTDKLGPVELRARVVGDEVGAAITVEKRDAHAALAVELPALQQALSEKQLRVDQVTLVHGSLHSTSGDTGEAAREQSQRQAPSAPASRWQTGASPALQSRSGFFYGSDSSTIFDSQGRLSVHA
jgi:hypothetical protein